MLYKSALGLQHCYFYKFDLKHLNHPEDKAKNLQIFLKSFPFCLMGTIIGSVFFIHNNSQIIIFAFGLFLLFLAKFELLKSRFKSF